MLEKLLGPTYLLYIVGLPENRILLEIYGKHLAIALSKWGQQLESSDDEQKIFPVFIRVIGDGTNSPASIRRRYLKTGVIMGLSHMGYPSVYALYIDR